MSVDPATYTEITWRDAEGDDMIADTDTDDASTSSNDRVIINGVEHSIREIGGYPGGTMVANGVTYTVNFSVWLLDDGTYLVRIRDEHIPPDLHYKKVESLTLGTFDNVEYSHSLVSTRDEPFLCFVAGTLIHTFDGLIPVEDLLPGDLVLTADNGFRPLRWSASRRVAGRGPAAPVLITAGTLGNSRDLRLSQQHRILVSDWRAELLFGTFEVLVAALHLVNGQSIRLAPSASVKYVHLLFDKHELIFSEGILTESFHPDTYGLSLLDQPTRDEVLSLFPDLGDVRASSTARPCLRGWEARSLAQINRSMHADRGQIVLARQ
ncbi:MAG: Hint domain-containing protein [Pseudotabrizicola sp.]|uniref:Hint domain-containing protein n=1 Tax=Pseudotabrizicola sp. TaxID=2939647 RepID=UPI00272512CB|nr:Hint domain-containing protein [Pseudotabrizicola sp.]MDO8883753.1 Hint domain-containing protein [Pseudotabrizicola sp.]MDP2081726.1 Hint domain-containing protein [Pseudotabrizicola sp.]MDZ7573021.1 Hint domain-containing protein [Pseudotabrizicola sp.]